MNIWKRAGLFITRKKSKTLILLLILTIISFLVMVCIMIGSAGRKAATELRETMGGYFKIQTNRDQGYSQSVTDELVRDVMGAGGIKAYNGVDMLNMLTPELQLEPGRFTREGDEKAKQARFIGNTNSELNEYFVLRSFSLLEGRHIKPDDSGKIMISEMLANRNHLAPGDQISVRYLNKNSEKSEQHSFEIVGIYRIDGSQIKSSDSAECDIAENFIFVDTSSIRKTVEEQLEMKTNTYSSGAVFFVKDAGELENIVDNLTKLKKYNWDEFTIIKNNKLYDQAAGPLERMSGMVTTIIVVIIVISIALLSLVLFMWMRDRIHEIGVLLSIGLKRTQIFAQLILENLVVAVTAFIIALLIVKFLDFDKLYSFVGLYETESAEINQDEYSKRMEAYYDPVKVDETDPADLMQIQFGWVEIIEIAGIGFLILIISTGVSALQILKMKPRDILITMS